MISYAVRTPPTHVHEIRKDKPQANALACKSFNKATWSVLEGSESLHRHHAVPGNGAGNPPTSCL
jgi:hypothetical protein